MNAATDIDMNAVALFAPEARMAAVDVNDRKSGSASFSEVLRSSDPSLNINEQKQSVKGVTASVEPTHGELQTGTGQAPHGKPVNHPAAANGHQSPVDGLSPSKETPDLGVTAQRQGLPAAGKVAPLNPALTPPMNGIESLSPTNARSFPSSLGQLSLAGSTVTAVAPGKPLSAGEVSEQSGVSRSGAERLSSFSTDPSLMRLGGGSQVLAEGVIAERLGDLRSLPSTSNLGPVPQVAELGRSMAQQVQGLSLEQPLTHSPGQGMLRGVQVVGREAPGVGDRSTILRGSMTQGRQASSNGALTQEGLLTRRGATIEGLGRASWITGLASTVTLGNSVTPPNLAQPFLNLPGPQGQEAGLLPTTMRLPSGFELSSGTAQGQLLSSVHQPAWAQELAQQAKFMVRDALKFAELKLTPANLGTVEVVVKQEDQQTTLMFFAKNPAVREALEASLQRLQKSFEDDGLNLEGTFVSDQSLSEHRQQATEDFSEHPSGLHQDADRDPAAGINASKKALPVDLPGSERLLDIWA